MPTPTIQYNASTGSDTAASGAGPATAVTGTNGDILTTTLTLNETVDFTGVADDGGSDALWFNGSAGDRHLFSIASFTGGVATCTAIVVNETATMTRTGSTWAVGGKRQTFNNDTSNRDWSDILAGWTFQLEAGTYDTPVQIVVVAGDQTNGQVTFQAATATAPTIRSTANVRTFSFTDRLTLDGITFTTNSGTKTLTSMGRPESANAFSVVVKNCIVDGLQKGAESWNTLNAIFINTQIANTVSDGFIGVFDGSISFLSCWFDTCGGHGIDLGASSGGAISAQVTIDSTVFSNCGTDGLRVDTAEEYQVIANRCSFYSNGSDGLEIYGTPSKFSIITVMNSIFSENGGYGINGISNSDFLIGDNDHNAFYNNTSGARQNLTAGSNDVVLSADPFTTKGSDDFSLNSTAGGGADCRAAGSPGSFIGGTMTGNVDIGAIQHGDPAGGGGTDSILGGGNLEGGFS